MNESNAITRIGTSPIIPLPISTTHPPNQIHTPPNQKQKQWNKAISTSIRSRLSKLCREGQPHLALHLLDSLPRPSTVVWNSVIIGFICNNLPNQALLLYAKMRSNSSSSSSTFDPYTFSSTLKACALTKDIVTGKAIHSHFLRSHSYSNTGPSRIVYNSLLNMYASCQHEYTLKVFDVMRRRNVVAWNTLILWYVKMNRYPQAVEAFASMINQSVMPSPVTFVNLFPALSKLGDSSIVKMFYGFMRKFGDDYVNDVFVVSSAILMFADVGCMDYARMVFDRCLSKNTEIWNTMIGAYVQNNCPVEAIDVFIQALESEEGVCDDVTLLSVLTAVSQVQQIKLAEQFHAFAIKSLPGSLIIISNAVMVMYSRCNHVDTSFKVFDKMFEGMLLCGIP
jgi:pentatricopeptide repeat protein